MKANIIISVLLVATLAIVAKAQNFRPTSSLPVIVIGAGMSGAQAARTIADAGVPVIVLEARNRIGGRMWSNRSLGFSVDLGASWIHGASSSNPLTGIATKLNLPTFQTNENSVSRWRNDGTAYTDTEQDNSFSIYRAFKRQHDTQASTNLDNGVADTSIGALMKSINNTLFNDVDLQWQLSSVLEFDFAAPVESISSQIYNNDKKFSGSDVLFPNGYDQMVSGVLGNITVNLNTIVKKIDYSLSDRIAITTSTGQVYNASKIVVTIPIGVLQANDVTFVPALPTAKTTSIGKFGVGSLNKVALLFPSQFWPTSTQFFGFNAGLDAMRGRFSMFVNVRTFSTQNALVTFGFGQASVDIEALSDTQIINEVMVNLKKMFGTNIPNPTGILRSNWGSDQFARGSYSYPKVGMLSSDYTNLAAAVGSNIYFAGEHCSKDYRAAVHGAYLTGTDAGTALVASIPPPTPVVSPKVSPKASTKVNAGNANTGASMAAIVMAALVAFVLALF